MQWLVFLFCVSGIQTIVAISGIYFDNGFDQTVMERAITKREKMKFEKEMLDLLGLPRKPPKKVFNATHNLERSAPKFLYEVYKSLEGSKLVDDFNLETDVRSIKESDTIMTFLTKNNHVNNVRHEKGKRLWFDISDVPAGDSIVAAELRLYKIYNEDLNEDDVITVTVHQVIIDFHGEKELEALSSVNITNGYEGWLVFNVSAAFTYWQAFPQQNKGLYVSVHKHLQSGHEIHPLMAGIISDVAVETENQPFMVAFFKHSNNLKPRHTRDVNKRTKKSDDVSYNTNPFTSESSWTLRSCQIQTLYVNFKDLNWHEWIIAPDGYAAFYCSGLCDFPLNAHMNATNHAIVQTLVHLINPMKAPKPCCAPTKLGSIAVLYYLEDNNVILKKYKNMIVKSCGCH